MFVRLFMHFWLIVEFLFFWICGLFSYKFHCRLRYELYKMRKIIEYDSVQIDLKIAKLEKASSYSELQKVDLN